jgi:hypothetical protein
MEAWGTRAKRSQFTGLPDKMQPLFYLVSDREGSESASLSLKKANV